MSETVLRSRFLLSTIFTRNGETDAKVLADLLSPRTVRGTYPSAGSEDPPPLKKSEITAMLLRTIPPTTENMPLNELLQMAIGLTAVLSIIGLGRKEAFILMELLHRLTPSLLEARKIGAAEMGIHPDAESWSLGSVSTAGFARTEKRTKSLLRLVGSIYASLDSNVAANEGSNESSRRRRSLQNSKTSAPYRNVQGTQADGNFRIKLDILKSSVALCDIIPDYAGVLKYSLDILHLCRATLLVPSDQSSGRPAISSKEQAKAIDDIQRSIRAATKSGASDTSIDYWDEYLVRGIELVPPPEVQRTTAHVDHALEKGQNTQNPVDWGQPSQKNKNPFIYKPSSWLSPEDPTSAANQPLVAGEKAFFHVYLQNPFEVEIEIDHIALATTAATEAAAGAAEEEEKREDQKESAEDGKNCGFEPGTLHKITLGPFCCQRFTLAGTAKKKGNLKLTGCRAKIGFCKERCFSIFPSQRGQISSSLSGDHGASKLRKDDAIGARKSLPVEKRETVTAKIDRLKIGEADGSSQRDLTGPIPPLTSPQPAAIESKILELTVISPQPILSLQSTTLSQPALMLLEGEKKRFEVVLKNESSSSYSSTSPSNNKNNNKNTATTLSNPPSADLVRFHFQDSATEQLQAALKNQDLSPSDLHELNLQLVQRVPFRLVGSRTMTTAGAAAADEDEDEDEDDESESDNGNKAKAKARGDEEKEKENGGEKNRDEKRKQKKMKKNKTMTVTAGEVAATTTPNTTTTTTTAITNIPPGATATFIIEVLGIPGLRQGSIDVEYAHLDIMEPIADNNIKMIKERRYWTRRLSLSVAVTVNAAIETARSNVIRAPREAARQGIIIHARDTVRGEEGEEEEGGERQSSISGPSLLETKPLSASNVDASKVTGKDQVSTDLVAAAESGRASNEHCLLLLDIRNAWPFPLSVSLRSAASEELGAERNPTSGSYSPTHETREELQPGHTSRMLLKISRIHISDPFKPIPTIDSQRQFVVSATKPSVQTERASREAFWFREELLKQLSGTWQEKGTGREGTIDLRRGIRLNTRMIDALKIEDVGISISIRSSSPKELPAPQQITDAHYLIAKTTFLTLSVQLHNRSVEQVHGVLRISPTLRGQPAYIALDLSKRLAWTGMLQQALHPPLSPGEKREVCIGLMAISVGEFEISASLDELKVRKEEATMGLKERRIWHAKEACLLDAVEKTAKEFGAG